LEHPEIYNSEKKLLLLVSEGNEVAFRQLYYLWQPHLSSFIFSITQSSDLTAEIVQDVFLKIWLNRENLSIIDNFKAYLFTISRNYALNELRNSMRKYQQFQKWEKHYLEELNVNSDDTKTSDLAKVDEAIDKLSERQRKIYLLHRHEKLTYQQIAERLNISKETVKTHLELAVKSIIKHLRNPMVLLIGLINLF
jgi:RNA polymerase sigma-70 factor (family 1)